MENFQTQYLPEEHGLIITDVRFRPNSSQLATSSFDRTIKLWNAADVSCVYMSLGNRGIIYCTSDSDIMLINPAISTNMNNYSILTTSIK
jgi:WD40 repeat protein